MSLITRILPPDEKGFKLTFQEMDNNLYQHAWNTQSLDLLSIHYDAPVCIRAKKYRKLTIYPFYPLFYIKIPCAEPTHTPEIVYVLRSG